MPQIPLDPIGSHAWQVPRVRRPGRFRSVFRGLKWMAATPVQWFGTKPIRDGATFVGDLAGRVRARPRRDPRFHTRDDGGFDRRATAFSYGISDRELERRLRARRRQTALTAYSLMGLAAVFLAAWVLKVLGTTGAGTRMLLAIDFLPVCLLFLLLAFYQALINFQIRVGWAADWREYLTTEGGFWPRP